MAPSGRGDDAKARLMISEPSGDDKQRDEPAALTERRLLHHRTKSTWIVACYSILLLLPWSLTVAINYRSIGGASYFDQAGRYARSQFDRNFPIIGLINIVNAIAALVTIPVIDAVLSQAAIAFTQRTNSHRTLRLGQTLALADRRWKGLSPWYEAFRFRNGGVLSRMLVYATGLVIIGTRSLRHSKLRVIDSRRNAE